MLIVFVRDVPDHNSCPCLFIFSDPVKIQSESGLDLIDFVTLPRVHSLVAVIIIIIIIIIVADVCCIVVLPAPASTLARAVYMRWMMHAGIRSHTWHHRGLNALLKLIRCSRMTPIMMVRDLCIDACAYANVRELLLQGVGTGYLLPRHPLHCEGRRHVLTAALLVSAVVATLALRKLRIGALSSLWSPGIPLRRELLTRGSATTVITITIITIVVVAAIAVVAIAVVAIAVAFIIACIWTTAVLQRHISRYMTITQY